MPTSSIYIVEKLHNKRGAPKFSRHIDVRVQVTGGKKTMVAWQHVDWHAYKKNTFLRPPFYCACYYCTRHASVTIFTSSFIKVPEPSKTDHNCSFTQDPFINVGSIRFCLFE